MRFSLPEGTNLLKVILPYSAKYEGFSLSTEGLFGELGNALLRIVLT
jgi:hypothetical protein